jgi:hypothetical protein
MFLGVLAVSPKHLVLVYNTSKTEVPTCLGPSRRSSRGEASLGIRLDVDKSHLVGKDHVLVFLVLCVVDCIAWNMLVRCTASTSHRSKAVYI